MADRSDRRDADGRSVLTANRLLDGRIVWRTDAGWTDVIDAADIVSNTDVEDAIAKARAHAQADGVVGVYGVQIGEDGRPVTVRERIRAFGPSTHPAFATLAKGDHHV
ncbi:DUF2849 domain-containing protein [Tanticharoenia sakaeratensis]|uniref:DUF2849 domain-containing protein n=1 Tax=Tanticharoenia sakaeratensis NBRC 103193 TaxID=1231623 RepID=A0A0D6MH18_9PROT|nr:DUF2849 domain-containing protein [Tanticharoenia sakaeratensis]GAN52791.1 hypothetical protein Tasa_002_071 [Tanticharoenia sakaeratensis NBRC 103193]GBQ18029.1 hypothetical protein AA103193_0556 [Tanticharoenia sakaeratensis NBRC 103193]